MNKKFLLIVGLLFLMTILTGCTEFNQPITSESEGFWNEYIVYPLSQLIIKTAAFAGGSYGISIIIVTILVRLVILPLMIKQTRNSKAMQAIQPQMKELQQKYSSKDQKTQQKLQEETMKLFQENKVNPLSGCFPLIVQMPILIGFYHAISRTREIASHDFLWFSLGQPDPIYLLPIVAGVTTFIQTKLSMAGAPPNPQMQMMVWIMPVMILVFAINFPAALSLYWVVGNIFTIIQTYFIKGPEIKNVGQTSKAGGAKK
ncbi:YidC family membrane integrase SpoIIIJ [Cytobacillus oceanisediminis]|uniref:Membrane protein insertase YidC n=3 Tax=Bacillales TaxID=1385 RepID=A0A941GF63_NIACI|nr:MULTISPECIES: YidC family membrane integrase SpoIIIJ [Bacillaceae]EOR25739.1 OxaA-like protein precursor [Niallia nealsonii AAU1]MDU1845596.1 YidC family membrane integrase SpoIIIJ [Niallia nealsonii]MBZ9534300.1 YidC family membrane integrase SpoIIIJ [Cytobacillus oceanisediminis]MCB5239289.1 YidC family membrane integrase SpoIIIJ [Niallia circulans]MED3791026.1 YidC family membrane integrase SpoIIIJ [Niallia alba]